MTPEIHSWFSTRRRRDHDDARAFRDAREDDGRRQESLRAEEPGEFAEIALDVQRLEMRRLRREGGQVFADVHADGEVAVRREFLGARRRQPDPPDVAAGHDDGALRDTGGPIDGQRHEAAAKRHVDPVGGTGISRHDEQAEDGHDRGEARHGRGAPRGRPMRSIHASDVLSVEYSAGRAPAKL